VLRPPLICVVDDDASVRKSLCNLLLSVGYRAIAFSSAEEFLQSGEPENPNCLLLDVRMPGMNGFQLQRSLKDRKHEIPIIFITAHGNGMVRERALSAGAVDCLLKPFTEEELLSAVRSALKDG